MSVHLYTSSHFPLTAYCSYISRLAARYAYECSSVLGFASGLTTAVRNFCCSPATGKDGQPYTVVPKVSQVTLEEMIGNSALRANASIFSTTNSGRPVSSRTGKVSRSTLLFCVTVSSLKSAFPPHNLALTELHACDNCRHRWSPGDV
jgi:hypothetical protein